MNLLRGGGALLALNLQSVRHRPGAAVVVLIAFAVAAIVFLSVFEMSQGFESLISSATSAERAILLQRGASSEVGSTIDREQLLLLQSVVSAPASPELVTAVRLHAGAAEDVTLIPLRGLESGFARVRPEVQILSGRAFVPGRHEVILGQALAREYRSLQLGSRLTIKGQPWQIVGTFASGGSIHESEIFADRLTLGGALGKDSASAVVLRLQTPQQTLASLEAQLASNSRLTLTAQTERDYYDHQSSTLREVLRFLAYLVGAVMALGACLAALNAMYSAVEARRTELGVLRALGARPESLLWSIVLQSLLLGGLGTLLGVLASWVLFDGKTFSTLAEGQHLTELVIQMHTGIVASMISVACGCVIGAVAGFIPALTALWIQPLAALRAT